MNKISPFNSVISPGFWQKFSNLALEQKSVAASEIPIWGYYGPTTGVTQSIFTVDHTSFDTNSALYYNQLAVKGNLITTNSYEEFKKTDKNALIAKNFKLENVDEDPRTLAKYLILAYPDLKSYTFIYWFAFPSISSIHLNMESRSPVPENLLPVFESCKDLWRSGFFLTDIKNCSIKSLKENTTGEEIYSYLEPSGVEGVPGWVIRNFLAYIIKSRKLKSGDKIQVLSLLPKKSHFTDSCIYDIKLEFSDDWESSPKILGWERNGNNLAPRVVDLKSTLDPVTLCESFVDFNLKLMKWNLFPELNLEMMHEIKVCMLGAGTLGCNVARTLMGWGVRRMCIVDSGTVTYSNPVRQSLYTYKDSGRDKAVVAAERLKEIFPGMSVEGFNLQIPMPGHPSSPSTIGKIKADYLMLENLIRNNDVIFLLTDTRESRWLPTLLGAAFNKIVINAALGFDSYVVIRHGRETEDLGCYFCTDVVVPGDSTQDRTLDQQCTVTRPGVSMMAGSLAVELMVSLLHYDKESKENPTLGVPPHSLRGFLSSNNYISPVFAKFDKCSACSEQIVNAFKEEGIELVLKVLGDPQYVETITGLDKLKEDIEDIVEWEEDLDLSD